MEIWISDDIEELWYEKDTINDGTGAAIRDMRNSAVENFDNGTQKQI